MTPQEALRRSALFSQLSDQEIVEVASILTERKVASGETLIREGDEGYSLFILEEGSVDVLRNGEQGQPARITELAAGAMFGEMSFIEHAPIHSVTSHPPRSAGVVAHGTARVLELRYDSLEKLAQVDPVLGVKLYRALAVSLNEKLKNTTDHLLPLIASARMAALGQMTANIAHELNNPLGVLRALSESIAQSVSKGGAGDSREVNQWAEKISATVARIGRVIAGLRTVSRDGSGDPVSAVDPVELIRQTLEFCEQRLRYFGIHAEVEEPRAPLRVACRPVQISQALLNLLNNSVDAISGAAAHEKRWIRLSVEERGDQVLLAVTDSGPGIPSAVANRMFRPFFTTKGPGAGTGLGLSISRSLVQANEGTLCLDGESRNTRFLIWLPRG